MVLATHQNIYDNSNVSYGQGFPTSIPRDFFLETDIQNTHGHACWPAAVRRAACWQNKGSKTVINQIVGVKNNINGPDEAWDMRIRDLDKNRTEQLAAYAVAASLRVKL